MEEKDEIIIETEFMRDIISKLIMKALKNKFEHNVDVELNELVATDENEELHVHLSVDAKISMNELEGLLKSFNVI